ncbi:MAG: hypothetical protein ACHQ16_00540 [Candidatus Lutacidiplasmatales archaeon]
MDYDPNLPGLLLFGGTLATVTVPGVAPSATTWRWYGSNWSELHPTASPPPRSNGALVFDPVDNCSILFGGEKVYGALGDTWEFFGGSWHNVSSSMAPSPRFGAAAAWDPVVKAVVLFGGNNGSGWLNDTWQFVGGVWTNVSKATAPPQGTGLSLAYDAADGYDVLTGDALPTGLNSTWTYSNGTWQTIATNVPAPTNLGGVLAYDPISRSVEYLGGIDAFGAGGTWKFQNASWTQSFPLPAPIAVNRAGMAFDPLVGAVVAFGGAVAGNLFAPQAINDTWLANGSSWRLLAVGATFPDPTGGGSFGFDAALNASVLFGGNQMCYMGCSAIGTDFGETWVLSAGSWQLAHPAGTPDPLLGAAMAYDSTTRQMILFGGQDSSTGLIVNDTWSFSGGNWTRVDPGFGPSIRFGAQLADDPADHAMLLFGGDSFSGLNDTWLLRNGSWTNLSPPSTPAGRGFGSMAFDLGLGVPVLFGGCSGGNSFPESGCGGHQLNDTWAFENGNWVQVPATVHPPGTEGSTVTEFGPDGRLVEWGGSIPGQSWSNESWAFNGTEWFDLNVSGAGPEGRLLAEFGFDPTADAAWLFGGFGRDGSLWQLRPPSFNLSLSAPTANRSTADVGLPIALSVQLLGGGGPLTFTWLGLPGCPSVNATSLMCTPTVAGLTTVSVAAATPFGARVVSPPFSLPVGPPLQAGNVTVLRDPSFAGGALSLEVSPSGGTPPYSIVWTGLPRGCAALGGPFLNCTPGYPGNDSIGAGVSDVAGAHAATSPVLIDIRPVSPLGAVATSRTSLDLGQMVNFSLPPSNSFQLLAIDWTGLPVGCVSQNASTISCSPSSPGNFSVGAGASFGQEFVETATPSLVEVFADPSVSTITVLPSRPVAGANLTISATASPGSGGDRLAWSGLPGGCDPGSPSATVITCQPAEGTYNVSVVVTDSNGIASHPVGFLLSVALNASVPVPPGNSLSSLSPVDAIGIGALAATAVGVAVVLALLRRAKPPKVIPAEPTL